VITPPSETGERQVGGQFAGKVLRAFLFFLFNYAGET